MHELLKALRDRLRLVRRLGVDLAQQRLAEVRERGARETADETLGADDAELEARDLARAPRAGEDVHAGLLDDRANLVRAPRVEVVIAEHREHRNLEVTAGVGNHLCLLGLTR